MNSELSYFDPTKEEKQLLAIFNEVYEREWERAAENNDSSALYGGADNWATLCAIRAFRRALSVQGRARPVRIDADLYSKLKQVVGTWRKDADMIEESIERLNLLPVPAGVQVIATTAPPDESVVGESGAISPVRECVWTEDLHESLADTSCGRVIRVDNRDDLPTYCRECGGKIRWENGG